MSERLKRFFSHGGTIAFITGFFLYIAVVLPILINDKGFSLSWGITALSRYRLRII